MTIFLSCMNLLGSWYWCIFHFPMEGFADGVLLLLIVVFYTFDVQIPYLFLIFCITYCHLVPVHKFDSVSDWQTSHCYSACAWPEVVEPGDRMCHKISADGHTQTCWSSLRGIHVLSLSDFLSHLCLTLFSFLFFFLLSHAHKELKFVCLNIMGAGLYPKSLIKVLACILLWGKQGMMVWEEVKYIL